jgi:hypothetical protein
MHSLENNKVSAIFEDNQGILWIGTAGNGLHRMNTQQGSFERIVYDPLHPEKLSGPALTKESPNKVTLLLLPRMQQEAFGSEVQTTDLITLIPAIKRLYIIKERIILLQELMTLVFGRHLHPGTVFFGSVPGREIFTALILFNGIFLIMLLRVLLLHLFMRNLLVYFGSVRRTDFFVKT